MLTLRVRWHNAGKDAGEHLAGELDYNFSTVSESTRSR
jgi:hypothetical protein